MAKKPRLALVTGGESRCDAPRTLGEHGRKLWKRVLAEYDVADIGGLEMLEQACAAKDRAEALRAEIDRDGEIIRTRGVVKEHPALKHELACRSFVVRTLTRLGLNFEPTHAAAGRPGSAVGWTGSD